LSHASSSRPFLTGSPPVPPDPSLPAAADVRPDRPGRRRPRPDRPDRPTAGATSGLITARWLLLIRLDNVRAGMTDSNPLVYDAAVGLADARK